MDAGIILILGQDGVTSGAIYALLALALVLIFSVTRVIFIPQGEFVAFGALTLAMLQAGKVPATVWLLVAMGAEAVMGAPVLTLPVMASVWVWISTVIGIALSKLLGIRTPS